MKDVTIGFLGCGNIGGGVWRLLHGFEREIAHRTGLRFHIKRVLVRDVHKDRGIDIPDGVLTTHADDVLLDPEISIVVEYLGGEHPAGEWMKQALEHGKTVVTANKVALALHWPELQRAAAQTGAGLYFEAAVCGAIPVIHALNDSLQANRIDKIYGIVNGTTNYILTRMSKEGESYETVLRDAQRLGLAEPDPAADVEGYDAAYKLSILTSLAFHGRVPFEKIYVEGITHVSPEDIRFGQELGYTLKLLAIGKRSGMTVEARVHPTFIPNEHPLSNVSGSFNAVFLHGHACEDMMFQGRGAGDYPTASAVVSDLVRAAAAQKHPYPTFENAEHPAQPLTFDDDWHCAYYLRLRAVDEPGVLSRITRCFADQGVSIAAMQQNGKQRNGRVPLVFITHEAGEKAVQQVMAHLDGAIATVESMIRVEKE